MNGRKENKAETEQWHQEKMQVMIPILHSHNHQRVIGKIEIQGGRLCFRFVEPVSRYHLFTIFGNVGAKLTDIEIRNGETFVTAGEIVEFSLSPEIRGN